MRNACGKELGEPERNILRAVYMTPRVQTDYERRRQYTDTRGADVLARLRRVTHRPETKTNLCDMT